MSLKEIQVPSYCNYIACFLTLSCNLKCNFCINYFDHEHEFKKETIPGEKWIEGLNRLVCSDNLPITLQGGEPGLHPDFIWIINNIKKEINIDILTNLSFDVDRFINCVEPLRLKRNAPYPSIRVSYHPPYMDIDNLIKKVIKLQKAGFSIGIFAILHPKFKDEVLLTQERCLSLGIDFRTKEFLGKFNGRLYGNYRYVGAVGNSRRKRCLCRTSEIIIDIKGNIFRCHHDLYNQFSPVGNLLDPNFVIKDNFKECDQFGGCNPCDIKLKTDRFQVFGHTSVEIKDIKEYL